MSRQLVETKLRAHEGPIHISTAKLQDLIPGFNGVRIERAARRVPGFCDCARPETEDGYAWFWGVWFRIAGGKIAVLIPWFQDWEKNDGSEADRAVAVYRQGDVADAEIVSLLDQICGAFAAEREWREKFKEQPAAPVGG